MTSMNYVLEVRNTFVIIMEKNHKVRLKVEVIADS